MAAVPGVEGLSKHGLFFSQRAPDIPDGCEGGVTGLSGRGVALAQGLLHGVVGGEELGVLGVAIASPPCLIENGFSAGGIDKFVEAECGFFELVREDGGGLTLVLKNDKVVFSAFDVFDGFLFGKVEGEGFATRVDECQLGFGVRGRLDEIDHGLSNPAGVAVTDEENFFWRRRAYGIGFRLSESQRSEKGDEDEAKIVPVCLALVLLKPSKVTPVTTEAPPVIEEAPVFMTISTEEELLDTLAHLGPVIVTCEDGTEWLHLTNN